MKRPMNPCYECDARTAGCHAYCNRYDEYFKANAEYRRTINEERRKARTPHGREFTDSERRRKKVGGQR